MFRVASENNIDVYADSVSEFIRKCIGDVVPTVTIKIYPNQKPWIDGLEGQHPGVASSLLRLVFYGYYLMKLPVEDL
jgi:hypothetical protein